MLNMRPNVDSQKLERLMQVLGREAQGSGCIYFTGGASALLIGWRDRSLFIGKQGQISFYHYDFTAQALAKLSRGFDRDLKDVQAMYEQKLFSLRELQDCFEAIAPELIRFPSLNPDVLRSRVENFIEYVEGNSEVGQS